MSRPHADFPFSPPRKITDISQCYFYHVMDLPGYGIVGEEWDLRGGEDAYLGHVAFRGKRVLELGTASGHLCRYMESRGADVIGFDLAAERSWDLVPFAGLDLSSSRVAVTDHIERLKNGWWFTHQLFNSRAKVVYGDIYNIPEEIGSVDVAIFGAILLHLRDPFQALHSALRLTRETVIVTEVHPAAHLGASARDSVKIKKSPSRLQGYLLGLLTRKARATLPDLPHGGILYFLPNPAESKPENAMSWWCFSPEVICRFLGVLGFSDQIVTEHYQTYQGKRMRLYTVVANKRTAKS